MGWTRASSIERALACIGSTVLEPGPDHRSASTLEAAAWGTMVHHWKATGEIRSPGDGYEGLCKLLLKRLRAAWGDPDGWEAARARLWPGGVHELSVAVYTGHVPQVWSNDCIAEESQDQKKWTDQWSDAWVTGNLDYLGDLLGDPWVDDLKTGRHPPDPHDPQLAFYALAAWLLKDKPERVVTSITHWPRSPVGGHPERYWGEFTSSDLDFFHRRLIMKGREREGLRLYVLDGGTPSEIDLTTGSHCKYCPARINCPALAEAHENGEDY